LLREVVAAKAPWRIVYRLVPIPTKKED